MKRKKKIKGNDGPTQITLVRGIRCLGFKCDDQAHKLAAFMNIFHPERGITTVRMARDMREEKEEPFE